MSADLSFWTFIKSPMIVIALVVLPYCTGYLCCAAGQDKGCSVACEERGWDRGELESDRCQCSMNPQTGTVMQLPQVERP